MLTKKELLNNLDNFPYYKVFSIQKIDPDAKFNLKKNFYKFAQKLGKIRNQNYKKNKIIEIKPDLKKISQLEKKNTKIKSVLRYHQTNLGGSIHSDGPQHVTPPKYIIMACEQNSLSGGDTVLVNAKKIYQYLKIKKPKIFKILNKKILFERRGFNFKNNNVFFKPIFDVRKNSFIFRYLEIILKKDMKLKKRIAKKIKNSFWWIRQIISK